MSSRPQRRPGGHRASLSTLPWLWAPLPSLGDPTRSLLPLRAPVSPCPCPLRGKTVGCTLIPTFPFAMDLTGRSKASSDVNLKLQTAYAYFNTFPLYKGSYLGDFLPGFPRHPHARKDTWEGQEPSHAFPARTPTSNPASVLPRGSRSPGSHRAPLGVRRFVR